MKIFDYKFLILLGLTIIVYFLYREIENIKKKLLKNTTNNEKMLQLLNINEIDDYKDKQKEMDYNAKQELDTLEEYLNPDDYEDKFDSNYMGDD